MQITAPTCPYCNSSVTIAPGAVAGQRIVCGRCGEAFALRPTQTVLAAPAVALAITAMPPTAPVRITLAQYRRRFRGRNLALAVSILGVMIFMAAVGLIYALHTQPDRRANDTALKKRQRRPVVEEPLETPAVQAPARLAALGYLPKGTSGVLAVHVAELERDKVGRQLLDQPVRLGRVQLRPGQLAELCGLPRSQIDHVVLGVAADDLLLARAVLIVCTRQPYEASRVQETLQAERMPGTGRKNLLTFKPAGLGLPVTLWCVNDRTLALALNPAHLDAVPAQPVGGLDQLPDDVRSLLEKRIEPGAVAWTTGEIDEGTRKVVEMLLHVQKDDLERFAPVRAFAGWVQLHEQVSLGAVLRLRDERPAEELEKSLQASGAPGLTTSRDGAWVTIQYKTNLETMQKALER